MKRTDMPTLLGELDNERAAHAKTRDNFEAYVELANETRRELAALAHEVERLRAVEDRLRAWRDRWVKDRDSADTSVSVVATAVIGEIDACLDGAR